VYDAEYALPVVFCKLNEELPPIELRSQETAMPVLAGFVPAATVADNNVELPAGTVAGEAVPTADGFVEPAV